MPSISLCPRCQKPVSLPAGIDPATQVRCPLCSAEYALGEAIPPELIPLGDLVIAEPAQPSFSDIYGLREEHHETPVSTRTLAVAAAGIFKPQAPNRTLRKLVGRVASGLIGCLVGYYALAIYFGPRFKTLGFPELPLPFVARLIHSADKADRQGGKSSAATPANGKASVAAVDESHEPVASEPEPAAPATADKPKSLGELRSAGLLGPKNRPAVTSDELAAALKRASVISINNIDDPLSPKVYEAFCQLGNQLTFAAGPTSNKELSDRLDATCALLRKIAAAPKRLDKIGQLASQRLDAEVPQNAGILLAGTVKSVEREDRLWNTTVQLLGQSKTSSVVSREKMGVSAGDRILVLGVVVREPNANLIGYSGARPAVVWAASWAAAP